MAIVYSALCFGGRTGKTVTFTDAGDVVNLTAHGLRNGIGVVFSTTGSLPTEPISAWVWRKQYKTAIKVIDTLFFWEKRPLQDLI